MFDAMFDQNALLFTVPALLGTGVFLLKMGLMTLGGVGGDLDMEVDTDVDVDFGEAEAGDSTHAFNLLSIQTIASFMMGFGWGGLGGRIGLEWTVPMSLLLGAAFGVGFVWLLGILMKAMYDLQSSGNVRIGDAVGRSGSVYANVPAQGAGRGQVRIVIDDRARIYNAISDGEAFESGSSVRVVKVTDDRTLVITTA